MDATTREAFECLTERLEAVEHRVAAATVLILQIHKGISLMLGPQLTAAVTAVQTASSAAVTAEAALPQAVTDDQDVQNAITALTAVAASLATLASELAAMGPATPAPAAPAAA